MPIAPTTSARIVIKTGEAYIFGESEAARRALMLATYDFKQDRDGDIRREVNLQRPFYEVSDACTRVAIGHVPVAVRALRQAGHDVTVVDERGWPAESLPSDKVIDELTGDDLGLALAIATEPVGQVEVSSSRIALKKIILMLSLFPDARVTLVTASLRFAKKLRYKLSKALSRPIGMISSHNQTWEQVTVTTVRFAKHDDLRRTHVWIFCDVGDLTTQAAADTYRDLWRWQQHAYQFIGIRRSKAKYSADEQIKIAAYVGGVIYRVAGCPILPTVYAVSHHPSRVTPAASLLAQKRARWGDDSRNRLTADIAKAFVAQQVDHLSGFGIPLSEADAEWLRSTKVRVVVLVESTEQGQALQRDLPDWPLLSKAHGEVAPEQWFARHRIVTAAFAYDHAVPVEVLIRADGIAALPRLAGFPAPLTSTRRRQLVVDISDVRPDHAKRSTGPRHSQYRLAGWDIVDGTRLHRPAVPSQPEPDSTRSNLASPVDTDITSESISPARSGSLPDASAPDPAAGISKQAVLAVAMASTAKQRQAVPLQLSMVVTSRTIRGSFVSSTQARPGRIKSRLKPPPFSP